MGVPLHEDELHKDTRTQCRTCDLIYDTEEYGDTCVRCNPQRGRCDYCFTKGRQPNYDVINDDRCNVLSYCSSSCRLDHEADLRPLKAVR